MVSNRETAVKFIDMEEVYSFNEDLISKFILNHYSPQDGDRIAMFKLGWKSVKDYILFEWVPTGLPDNIEHQVVFEKRNLPQNTMEIYQICYISSENVLHGATIPFQFQNEACKSAPICLSSYEDILQRRNKRAAVLVNQSKSLEGTLSDNHSECEKQINELKFQIESLRRTVAVQQNEINVLKSREKLLKNNVRDNISREFNYDLGDLDPIPPFPLTL